MMGLTSLVGFSRRHWWHPRATCHLDFVDRRYFWAGRERNEQTDFSAWTGVTISANGALTSGLRGITVPIAGILAGNTGTLLCSFVLNSAPSVTAILAEIWDGTTNESVRMFHNSTPQIAVQTRNANVAQSSVTYTHDTGIVHALAVSWNTNDVKRAFDGVSSAVDSSAVNPASFTQLVIGNAQASVREVIVIDGNSTDAELAKYTGDYRR